MAKSLLRADKEIVDFYFRHVKTIYRVCFVEWWRRLLDRSCENRCCFCWVFAQRRQNWRGLVRSV